MKAINIRDFNNDPQARKAMGYFKQTAYKLKITQAELLKKLNTKSLKEINEEYDFKEFMESK